MNRQRVQAQFQEITETFIKCPYCRWRISDLTNKNINEVTICPYCEGEIIVEEL